MFQSRDVGLPAASVARSIVDMSKEAQDNATVRTTENADERRKREVAGLFLLYCRLRRRIRFARGISMSNFRQSARTFSSFRKRPCVPWRR